MRHAPLRSKPARARPRRRLSALLVAIVLGLFTSGCATRGRVDEPPLLDYCGNVSCNSLTYARWSAALASEPSIETRFYYGASVITSGGVLPPVAMGAIDSPGIVGWFARSALSPTAREFLRATNRAVFHDVRPIFMQLLVGQEPEGFEGAQGLILDCRLLAHEQALVEKALEALGPERSGVSAELSRLLSKRFYVSALPREMKKSLEIEMGGQIDFDQECQRRRFGLEILRQARLIDGAEAEGLLAVGAVDACTCGAEMDRVGF